MKRWSTVETSTLINNATTLYNTQCLIRVQVRYKPSYIYSPGYEAGNNKKVSYRKPVIARQHSCHNKLLVRAGEWSTLL